MTKLPQAKTENIVVQDLKNELLIYNLTTHQAFTLNETLKIIYQSCDGNTSFTDLQRSFKFTDDLIHLALSELSANDLLIDYRSDHFAGLSRREAIKRVGLASLIALPVIASLVAPHPAHAASGARLANGQACSTASQCQNNNCAGGKCCSGYYTARTACRTESDCCFGGNGTVFCGTNANGTENVCCSVQACSQTADCCAPFVCDGNGFFCR